MGRAKHTTSNKGQMKFTGIYYSNISTAQMRRVTALISTVYSQGLWEASIK
jgi:hypothetical protein